jgi:hypothetical protein
MAEFGRLLITREAPDNNEQATARQRNHITNRQRIDNSIANKRREAKPAFSFYICGAD